MPYHEPPIELLINRGDPEYRLVLEDWYLTQGAIFLIEEPGGDGDGYGDGGGDGYGDGDGGGDGYGGYGYGDGYGDGDGYGYGDGYGDGDGDGYGGDGYGDGGHKIPKLNREEIDVRDGLKIVSLPSGAYAYILVGWLRRIVGDEYELIGSRCIRRFGRNRSLAELAKHGPYEDTQLLEAAVEPEELHRLLIRRALPCNEKAWTKECPRPVDWKE